MVKETCKVNFKGYWLDENKGRLPEKSGIYCVYECTKNVEEDKTMVSLHKLICRKSKRCLQKLRKKVRA